MFPKFLHQIDQKVEQCESVKHPASRLIKHIISALHGVQIYEESLVIIIQLGDIT